MGASGMTNWTKNWLAVTRITEDPAGDLIADMRTDPNIPHLFSSRDAMRDYVRSKGACRQALAAVPIVWRRYKSWLDQQPLS
jgi:YozE SAM-like fold